MGLFAWEGGQLPEVGLTISQVNGRITLELIRAWGRYADLLTGWRRLSQGGECI